MNSSRFWFYLGSLIVIIGLTAFNLSVRTELQNNLSKINSAEAKSRATLIKSYLEAQADERKLIALAKLYSATNPDLLEPIIVRAYELNPQSRDITLLASHYRPELKANLKTLDPLYSN